MEKMLQILRREFWQSLHDARRIVFLFGAAVAYLLVFGALYTPNIITHIPCIVYNAEQSASSRELIRDFDASDSFRIIGNAATREEMLEAVQTKEAYVAIEIPADFSRQIAQHGASNMLFLVNGSNIIITNIASAAAQNITEDFSNKLAAHRTALGLGADEQTIMKRLAPVHCEYRVLGNATQGYTLFFLLGLAMVAFQQGIFFAVGASALYEVEHPQEAAAYKSWQLLLGKGIYYWCLSMLSYLLVVLIANRFWGIPLHASLSSLLLLAGFFCFAASAFCMLFASFFHTEIAFVRGIILYPVFAFIFSGYTWPQQAMGAGMQLLAGFFPLSWFSNTVRELFLLGHADHYTECLAALALTGIICFGLAQFIYRHSLARAAKLEIPETSENG
jgi:ABC-2 type transport system permease protein